MTATLQLTSNYWSCWCLYLIFDVVLICVKDDEALKKLRTVHTHTANTADTQLLVLLCSWYCPGDNNPVILGTFMHVPQWR